MKVPVGATCMIYFLSSDLLFFQDSFYDNFLNLFVDFSISPCSMFSTVLKITV